MSTQNLSEYDFENLPSKEILADQYYAIAVADWNLQITHSLLKGAVETLEKSGVKPENIKVVHVPGTFELVYTASQFAESIEDYDAIIVLGCVIKGETPHFDYICQGVTAGIAQLNTESFSPIIFGVLTTNNLQQALDRSGGIHGNKGVEAAITAIKMANIVW